MDNLDKLYQTYQAATPVRRSTPLEKFSNYCQVIATILLFLVLCVPVLLKNLFWLFVPKAPKKIKNQVVLVTGGANGLGRSLCFAFASEGCHIAVADLDYENAKKVAEGVKLKYQHSNVKAFAYKLDVSEYDAVEDTRKKIEHDLGPVDILINNAGILALASLREGTPSDLERIVRVNLLAQLWTNRVFLPSMIANKRGHIVAIGSIFGIAPTARGITYSASKCAVRGMMIALQDELEIDGLSDMIHTTTIFPWFINTRKELVENVTNKLAVTKMMRLITPERVASDTVEAVKMNKENIVVPEMYRYIFYALGSMTRDYRKIVRAIGLGDVPKFME